MLFGGVSVSSILRRLAWGSQSVFDPFLGEIAKRHESGKDARPRVALLRKGERTPPGDVDLTRVR